MQPRTSDEERAAASSTCPSERALRRKFAADKVAQIPIIEHALDLYAHGGPDMRAEAEALEDGAAPGGGVRADGRGEPRALPRAGGQAGGRGRGVGATPSLGPPEGP